MAQTDFAHVDMNDWCWLFVCMLLIYDHNERRAFGLRWLEMLFRVLREKLDL